MVVATRGASAARVVSAGVHRAAPGTVLRHGSLVAARAAVERVRIAAHLVAAAVEPAADTATTPAARVVLSRADFASIHAMTERRRRTRTIAAIERVGIAFDAIA